MESVSKFFLMAAGLIVTASLIMLGFRMADAGERAGNDMANRFIAFNTELKESDVLQYDGAVVNGSDVINFIRKNLSECEPGGTAPFRVVVETSVITVYEDNSMLKELMNFSHASYIAPTGRFVGMVERNENGVIASVTFIQK